MTCKAVLKEVNVLAIYFEITNIDPFLENLWTETERIYYAILTYSYGGILAILFVDECIKFCWFL